MTTIVVTHEVDDVDHWLASTKRDEFLGPLGITARTFVSRDTPNLAGLVVEAPSIDAWQSAMADSAAADAMKFDGVRPETLQVFLEG